MACHDDIIMVIIIIINYYYYNHLTASFPGQPG